MSLNKLVTIDNLQETQLNDTKVYIHDEHRFVLPILRECQLNGDLPMPCNVVLFDAHPDSAPYSNELKIDTNNTKITQNKFIDICNENLAMDDGNWVIAGFEFGIIKDILIFGVNRDYESFPDNIYRDSQGKEHKIFIFSSFPIDELHSQGWLVDVPKIEENQAKMNVIYWGIVKGKEFNFINDKKDLALIIDLDCFTIEWKDEPISWPDEFFEKNFIEEKGTQGWTGKKFMELLYTKIGAITIAKEPNYCGNMEVSNKILNQVNRYLFENKLKI